MALIIKSFYQILKQRRGKDYKPRSKKVCYKCGKPGHFIAKCPLSSDSDRGDEKRERGGKRRNTTRRWAAMPMFTGSGTPTRAPPTPPPTRTPQTLPSTRILLGVCFVAEDPKEREHLRQILSGAAPKLSPIKLRHSDRSQDEGVNRLNDEMT
jgi:hypothetical protein